MRAALLVLLASTAFAAGSLDLKGLLPRSHAGFRTNLGNCASKRCLTVFVAPWCGHCKHSAGMIKNLSQSLNWKGVKTRVVVTGDTTNKMEQFAQQFGFDALIDDKKEVPGMGVPTFALSDDSGRVLKTHAGEFSNENEARDWILDQAPAGTSVFGSALRSAKRAQ